MKFAHSHNGGFARQNASHKYQHVTHKARTRAMRNMDTCKTPRRHIGQSLRKIAPQIRHAWRMKRHTYDAGTIRPASSKAATKMSMSGMPKPSTHCDKRANIIAIFAQKVKLL